jgi:hypothetical protein
LFAVQHQDGVGLHAVVRVEHRLAISPPGRQLSVRVGLYGSPRFLLLKPNTWFGETSGYLFAKNPGRLLGSLLNLLQANLNQYLAELLVPKEDNRNKC